MRRPDHDVVHGDGRTAGARPGLVDRRSFLVGGGAALAGGGFAAGVLATPADHSARAPARVASRAGPPPPAPGDWAAVRAQFAAPPRDVHLDGFVLAVPPLAVRSAVERYRSVLDVEGIDVLHERQRSVEAGIRHTAARYMRADSNAIALTDSTTMGLGLVYGAARLRPGDELVHSVHDFYAAQEAMRFAAARTGAAVKTVHLYADPAGARAEELVARTVGAIGPRTRMVHVTWVHSSSGVRYPVRALADRLAGVNAERSPAERVLLVVDGVHGFGVEATAVSDLGCDVFVSGCHKWLCGPRGTGVVWARRTAWPRFSPVIPTFDGATYEAWRSGQPVPLVPRPWAAAMTPGGFHSFENRWALAEAFDFHRRLGRAAVASRIASLVTRLRTGLGELRNVRLVSPDEAPLRSAIVCFMVDGVAPERAVERLRLRGVHLSVTPYRDVYLRAGCPLWVDEHGVDRAIAEIAAL